MNEIAKAQIDIIRQRCEVIKPLVVIECTAYNHEPYIRDALEGFVMQKTDFPFVVIVHDDASTDNTAMIIKEYAEKYPDIIFPIYEKENQYSKKDGSIGQILRNAKFATNAKYIALCEGDDYWIDSTKLQNQINFLENNTDFSFCGHNVITKIENDYNGRSISFNNKKGTYTNKYLLRHWIIPTCSIVCRLDLFKSLPTHKNFKVGDFVLTLHYMLNGKFYLFDAKWGCYRLNGKGWTATKSNKSLDYILHLEAVIERFEKYNGFNEIRFIIDNLIQDTRIRYIEHQISRNPCNATEIFLDGLKFGGSSFIFRLLKKIPVDLYKSIIYKISKK